MEIMHVERSQIGQTNDKRIIGSRSILRAKGAIKYSFVMEKKTHILTMVIRLLSGPSDCSQTELCIVYSQTIKRFLFWKIPKNI